MKRANQISYGDLFSSSNFSQSPYENRLKKHPSETCLESHSQGNSQMMFSQSEIFESQNLRTKVLTPNEVSSRRLVSDVSVNSYQKPSSNGRFQPPSKSLAPTQLGLCRAMAQEFEERETLEAVLSSLKNHSLDIKELGQSLQEKFDYSSVLTSELVAKQSENIKDLLSKQFSELSRTFTTAKESSDDNISITNLAKEVGELKATMVNRTTNFENLSKLVEENRKLADKSLKITESLKKEIYDSLCIYAKEQTDLLRCFKEKIEINLNNKLESLASNLLEKLSSYSYKLIKKVCEKDVQTDAQTYDARMAPSYDKGFSSNCAKNQTYSINNVSGSTKRSFASTSQDYGNSCSYEELSTSDCPVINLSIPKQLTVPSPKESSYMHDSAIESRMSTPLDLSMKNLVLDDDCVNMRNGNKRKPMGNDKLHDDDDDDDDLNSLVSDFPPQIGDQTNRQGGSVSLKTCTYQTTQKTVTFWGKDSNVLDGINDGCAKLSPVGNDRSLSFNCPKSTPLSKQTVDRETPECSNRGKLVLTNAGFNSCDPYKRQPLAANQSTVQREPRHKKVLVKPKKQKRTAVRRSRRTKNYSYLFDPSYNYESDFDCLEGSDKENLDPNAYGSRAYTRSKKRLVTKAKGDEDYSCTSNSTKSSSDSVSQLFTVLDIY